MIVKNEDRSQYLKINLSNGIKCVLYKRDEIHSVKIAAKVNVGSLDEEENESGISHLIEHLAFDGTKNFPTWDKLNTFLNDISGSSNAYTSDDHTKYYGSFPFQYLEEGIYYLSEVVLNPLYKASDIKKEVDIIIDEKVQYDDSTDYQMQLKIMQSRYSNNKTSFSRDVIGTVENLKSFSKSKILKHVERYYIPENISIEVVGNFDEKKIINLLEKYFGSFKNKKTKVSNKSKKKYLVEYPDYSDFKIATKQKLDINQYYLVINFPSLEFILTTQRERHLLSFLTDITASPQFQTSILWKRLREDLGIVYGISSWSWGSMSRSLFAIDTNFNPEYIEVVFKEILEGLKLIKEGKIGSDIFEKKKKRVIDTELIRYDSPGAVLDWIIMQEEEYEFHNEKLSISEYIELVKSYTFDDVVRLANKIYNFEKANIILVTKDSEKDVSKRVLSIWNSLNGR